MLSRVSHVWFYVNDLERSTAFYEGCLGLTRIEAWDEGVTFQIDSLVIGLHIDREGGTGGRSPVVVFEVSEDISTVLEKLTARGARFTSEISAYPYGKTASLVDPDGHSLEIYQRAGTVK